MVCIGLGKIVVFVIFMIECLKGYSFKVGVRVLIFLLFCELVLQILKVVKELGCGIDLKMIFFVGGDSLEEQFVQMVMNFDIVIVIFGCFLYLKVEMNFNFFLIKYVVFDEVDCLFEMGFVEQLIEIFYVLLLLRQILLFLVILLFFLVEFVRVGLQELSLVRLDVEIKVFFDMESVFFFVKGGEKEGVLLYIFYDIIKMLMGMLEGVLKDEVDLNNFWGKCKCGSDRFSFKEKLIVYFIIIFMVIKYYVEYIVYFFCYVGFVVFYIYGFLD